MPMIKKSITVTDQQEKWIQSQMASGKYGTDSELIREALREKQMRMNEIDYIRAKLRKAASQNAPQMKFLQSLRKKCSAMETYKLSN